MATEQEADTDILKLAAASLEASGYTVYLQPAPSILPKELGSLRPDAIAIGKKPNLVLELTREGRKYLERVERLQKAISGNKDWQLQLLFTGAKPSEEFDTLPLAYIGNTLDHIVSVAKEDARPALLMCWAYFEALARSLEPKSFAKPQSPGRVVEQLASMGYIGAKDADFLRSMAEKRNKFVHGQLSIIVKIEDIQRFIELIKGVIKPI
jgi:hypothetical protein